MSHPYRPGEGRLLWAIAAGVVRPSLSLLVRRDWRGAEHLPRDGRGAILCANHLSELDPLLVAHYLYDHGILASFLAKESLFRLPVLGAWLHRMGHVPVDRRSAMGGGALDTARRLLDAGHVIVIYPEGTLTADPDYWPMRGRVGAARLALETGAPVIPLAHWGGHQVFTQQRRLRPFPRRTVRVAAGPAVPLGDLAAQPPRREVLEAATTRILDACTAILAGLRGEPAPATRIDPSLADE